MAPVAFHRKGSIMSMKDSRAGFGWMSIVNHWSVAVLILGLLASGLVLEEMARGPDKAWLIGVHKQLGVLALVLALWRVVWSWMQTEAPGAVPGSSPWTARARVGLHLVLVIASVALPVSGVVMSLYHGHDVGFLGLTIPAQGEVEAIASPAGAVHALGGTLVMVAVAGHALVALKHHVVDRDPTLVRMLRARA
jgi:cytochrome b561